MRLLRASAAHSSVYTIICKKGKGNSFIAFSSIIFKMYKCRKMSQWFCHYITNYIVIKTKMYFKDSLDNDIICDFLSI